MKGRGVAALFLVVIVSAFSSPLHAGLLEDISRGLGHSDTAGSSLDTPTIAKGLKEALALGTARAVKTVSQRDGYFGNSMIRIMIPERIKMATDLLSKFGFQSQVDEFVLSMNRAAEKAAPMATDYFVSAVREMTIEDARKILQGGDTSATEYFKEKTGQKIQTAFKPVIQSSMQDVGVARSYNNMLSRLNTIPLGSAAVGSLDLEEYVTTKAVDGLFYMVGEEEKRIRTDPAARATELLRKVFGK